MNDENFKTVFIEIELIKEKIDSIISMIPGSDEVGGSDDYLIKACNLKDEIIETLIKKYND